MAMVKLGSFASRFIGRSRSSVVPVEEGECMCSVTPTVPAARCGIVRRPTTGKKKVAEKSERALPGKSVDFLAYVSDETECPDSTWLSDEDSVAYAAGDDGDLWSICVVPPAAAKESEPALPSLPGRFDGDWVLCHSDPDVMPWLSSLVIRGSDVVDGVGDRCDLVQGPGGPSVCGGVLRQHGEFLLRYGKSGRVQEYRRRGNFLTV